MPWIFLTMFCNHRSLPNKKGTVCEVISRFFYTPPRPVLLWGVEVPQVGVAISLCTFSAFSTLGMKVLHSTPFYELSSTGSQREEKAEGHGDGLTKIWQGVLRIVLRSKKSFTYEFTYQ
jgi:hypothetical protein